MIICRLNGGLGNQMFQYAAARIQAERLRVPFAFYMKNNGVRGNLGILLGSNYRLFEVFPSLRGKRASRWFAGLLAITPNFIEDQISDRLAFRLERRLDDNAEIFSSTWSKVSRFSCLDGFFQSEKYWLGRRDDVKNWYNPGDNVLEDIEETKRRLPCGVEQMIAVHVRLGDYRRTYRRNNSWVLGSEYFEKAFARFSPDLKVALFSDEPEEAASLLPRPVEWASCGNTDMFDLFFMSSFPNQIIANSSFSWWSAMLNRNVAPKIVAPKYHIGRDDRVWYPPDIKVSKWIYV
jgi:hypothetical protein